MPTRTWRLLFLIVLVVLGSVQLAATTPEHAPLPCPPPCAAR